MEVGTLPVELCLGFLEHRHPNWPNQPHVEPPSWREAFKQHFLASETWTKDTQDLESSSYLSLCQRRKGRRQLRVGVGGEFGSLQAALAAASPYDCLVLLPGVHEEQGEVVLMVMGPGTCQVKFCTFSQSSIHLHSVATCILENCEFTGSENASETVEGCPSSDHNWACKHLAVLAKSCAVSVQDSTPASSPVAERDSWGQSLLEPVRTCSSVTGEERSSFLSAAGAQGLLDPEIE